MEFHPKKSKIVIVYCSYIPKKKRESFKFTFGNFSLEIVDKYNYLGIFISSSGDVCSIKTYKDFF